MAIALIAANGSTVNNGSSLSFSLDLGSGSNRAVVVTAAEFASIDLSAGTCSCGGVDMGAAVEVTSNVSNNRAFAWCAPTSLTGEQTILITPPSNAYIDAIASSWSGVDQTTPTDAPAGYSNTFTGTPQTLAISVSAGGVAVDMMSRRLSGSSTTPDASQTRLHSEISSGGIAVSGASYKAGATQMQWTHAGSAGVSHVIVALKAAASAGFTAGATLAGVVASGSLQSVMSGFSAGATLASIIAGGSLGATPGTFVLGPIIVNGVPAAGAALDWVRIYSDAGVLLYERLGGSLDGSAMTTLSTPAAPPGTAVRIDWQLSTGKRRMPRVTMG